MNFHDKQLWEAVYVSANPFTSDLPEETFFDVKNVYATHWNDDLGTVPPEAVAEVASAAAEEYPNKRLIVHFMQPHYPFIGEIGRSFGSGDLKSGGEDIWTLLQNLRCPVDKTTVWEAYAENYRLTEPAVRRLQNELVGKVVVTADHGNLVGEPLSPLPVRGYGHPRGIRHPALVTVPWHELPTAERREVVPNTPKNLDEPDDSVVEGRLEALGYR